MSVSNQAKNLHLLWRSGFGPSISEFYDLEKMKPIKLYERIKKDSATPPKTIMPQNDFVRNTMKAAMMQKKFSSPEDNKNKKAEEQILINKQSTEDVKQMSLLWLDEMTNSKAQMREKMSLFWHGHFACRVGNSLYNQQLLLIIRERALGNFGELLIAVSKSAAMLAFLNNRQNRKKSPNENFAREVMELFTLGRGNYTETDIKEAAKAFTGWSFESDGTFIFNTRMHDDDSKTILGNSGNFIGDDVLDILLKKKETATFIVTKIYRFFVNERINQIHISWLSERFYDSNLHIGKLMDDIFTSDWFYSEDCIGTHIKSPVELLVGIRRTLPMQMQDKEVQMLILRVLGQWLFNPPNVAGWAGGADWIDSSSLMLRLRVSHLIKNEEAISFKPKENDDVQMGRGENPISGKDKAKKTESVYKISAQIDWLQIANLLSKTSTADLHKSISSFLLPVQPLVSATINDPINMLNRHEMIQSLFISLMSIPEYQLS